MDIYLIGKIFGIATFLLQLDLLAVLIIYLIYPNCWVSKFVKKYALYLVSLLGFAAIFGSLIYSEFLKFDPCKLCWVQRIFLYPTAIIGLVAVWLRDTKALWYTLTLSILGGFVSLYHYIIQMAPVSNSLPCATDSAAGGCGGIYVLEMGYITIPMMTLTLFMYIILLSIIGLRNVKENN